MFHRIITSFCLLTALFTAPFSAVAAAPFTFADVQAKAQDLAGTKYVPAASVPEFLTKLDYSDWSSISLGRRRPALHCAVLPSRAVLRQTRERAHRQ